MGEAKTGEEPRTKFCRDCGAEIRKRAEICPECGIRQEDPHVPSPGSQTGAQRSFVDRIATPASWIAAGFMLLLAIGTITESVQGMPVRMWTATVIYVLLALFAAPPVRGRLQEMQDVTVPREVVVVVIVVGTIANEGLIAPPLA